jgi:predicted HD superfamily hydrolase involved in NAD metabolism
MEELEKVALSLLKPNRVAHVLGCRDTAKEMAKVWGVDETDAARAGLLHDITKALSGPLQLSLCRTYGVELNEFSSKNPKTLHALTGSLVAERVFGENPAVVAAICSHTTGKANMNTLEKIIYVADYMEPNRDFPGVEQLRHLAFTDLDGALKMGLEMTIALLKEQEEVMAYFVAKGEGEIWRVNKLAFFFHATLLDLQWEHKCAPYSASYSEPILPQEYRTAPRLKALQPFIETFPALRELLDL